jgi:TctA family transporter
MCSIGAYSLENSSTDLLILSVCGLIAVLATTLGFPLVPMLLGFILGPLAEENLRRAMVIAGGDPTVFVTRPISLAIVICIVLLLLVAVMPKFRKQREVFAEG